jgi:HK97 family phage portal protein
MLISNMLAMNVAPEANPLEPRFWADSGIQSDAGIWVSQDTMLRCGAVLGALRFMGDAIAMCEPHVFEFNGLERKVDDSHYLNPVLEQPNAYQNGYRWRHLMMVWLGMWGNAYNRIVGSPTSVVRELRPLHPSRVMILDQMSDGSLLYQYSPIRGPAERIQQQEMLHFRGISSDGQSGLKIFNLIRNAVGIALSAERHISTFLKKGTRVSGVLSPTGNIGKEERTALAESWNEAFGGAEHTGTVAVLPSGVDFKAMAMDNAKAQLVEIMDWEVGDMLRFLGVPGVVVNYADKTSTYASAEAFYEKGGIKHCVIPWIKNFEEEFEFSLLRSGSNREIRFSLEVLLRSNTPDRFGANVKACGGPWETRNEIRTREGLNRLDDPEMDKVLPPPGVTPLGDAGAVDAAGAPVTTPAPAGPGSPPPENPIEDQEDDAAAQLQRMEATARRLAEQAASRAIRREIAAIQGGNGRVGAAVKLARDPEKWNEFLTTFYAEHAVFLSESLGISHWNASAYCFSQLSRLKDKGVLGLEKVEETSTPQLVAWVMGE